MFTAGLWSRSLELDPKQFWVARPEPKSFERWSRNLKFEFPVNTEQDCFEWSVLNGHRIVHMENVN